MKIKSLYVCVDDMARAIDFYTKLFGIKPIIVDKVYSVFDINGFRYGLFAYKEVGEHHYYGSNCLPSIELDSLELLKSKIDCLEICFPLTKIGNNYVVEVVDSESNHIELTTPL